MIRAYVELPPAFCSHDPQAAVAARILIGAIRAKDERLHTEHVGSSAVPGCGGKGYIDLLVILVEGVLDGTHYAEEKGVFIRRVLTGGTAAAGKARADLPLAQDAGP